MKIELEKIIKETVDLYYKGKTDLNEEVLNIETDVELPTNIDSTAMILVYYIINDINLLFSFISLYSKDIKERFRKTNNEIINEKINLLESKKNISDMIILSMMKIYRDRCVSAEQSLIKYLNNIELEVDTKYRNYGFIIAMSIIKGMGNIELNISSKIKEKSKTKKGTYLNYMIENYVQSKYLYSLIKTDYESIYLENLVFMARASDILGDGMSECFINQSKEINNSDPYSVYRNSSVKKTVILNNNIIEKIKEFINKNNLNQYLEH